MELHMTNSTCRWQVFNRALPTGPALYMTLKPQFYSCLRKTQQISDLCASSSEIRKPVELLCLVQHFECESGKHPQTHGLTWCLSEQWIINGKNSFSPKSHPCEISWALHSHSVFLDFGSAHGLFLQPFVKSVLFILSNITNHKVPEQQRSLSEKDRTGKIERIE